MENRIFRLNYIDKIVNGIDDALDHISKYSSGHIESIISENRSNYRKVSNSVESAIVIQQHNSLMKFGLAEIVATGKLHARGPQ